MGTPVAKTGDLLVYSDGSKKAVKVIVGNLSDPKANGSNVLSGTQIVRSIGNTSVLGVNFNSKFTINGNPVTSLRSRTGAVTGDLGGKYTVQG